MKTLKKVLSVALVLAMALSLVTLVGAANVSKYQDFTDADAIVNKEAVDTLVGLRVLDGLEDGSFGPEGYLTRAQAAAIIARLLLGRTVADGMVATTAPFADVPANHWAAKYIQYCASRGIINGMGDNTFVPNGEVTAAQFAKMLLVAAGYGKKGEYVGNDWAINAIVDAQNLKILDTGVDYMAPATRDLIARYAFNFYTRVALVNYSKDTEDYKAKTVRVGSEDVLLTLAMQQGIEAVDAEAVNGVASHVWVYSRTGVELTKNVWPNNDIRVIYTYADGTALYDLTTRGQKAYKASIEGDYDDLTYVVNGETKDYAADGMAALLGVTRGSYGKLGLVVSLVDTDTDNLVDTIVIIRKTAVTLTADPYVSASGTVTIAGLPIASEPVENVVGYQGLKKGDVVLHYEDKGTGVHYLEKAKSVSGQLTAGNAGMLTFGGGVYRQSYLALDSFATIVANRGNFGVDAMVWLDNGGGVVKFELTGKAPTLPMGVLVGYRYDSMTGTAMAKIAKEDGVVTTFSVAPNVYGVADDQRDDFAGFGEGNDGSLPYGYLVTYSLDDQGRVKLYKVVTDGELDSAYDAKKSVVVIEANVYDEDGDLAGTHVSNYYLTNATKVFYFDVTKEYSDTNRVAVTTGYAATDEVADGSAVSFVLAESASTTTNVLRGILFGVAGTPSSATDKYVFATKYSGATTSYDAFGAVYSYNVYEGDQLITLKSRVGNLFPIGGDYMTVAGIYKVAIDAQGFATRYPSDAKNRIMPVGEETILVADGYIACENDVVILTNENTKYFVYDADNAFAPVAAGAIAASSTYVHYVVEDVLLVEENGPALMVYYTYTVD